MKESQDLLPLLRQLQQCSRLPPSRELEGDLPLSKISRDISRVASAVSKEIVRRAKLESHSETVPRNERLTLSAPNRRPRFPLAASAGFCASFLRASHLPGCDTVA